MLLENQNGFKKDRSYIDPAFVRKLLLKRGENSTWKHILHLFIMKRLVTKLKRHILFNKQQDIYHMIYYTGQSIVQNIQYYKIIL